MRAFISFWWDCLLLGWGIGYGIFAVIEAVCVVVIAAARWWPANWRPRKAGHFDPDELEGSTMKWAVLVLAVSFMISTVVVAPFLQFKESDQRLAVATNELARLTPTGAGATPYAALAKELEETRGESERQKARADKAEAQSAEKHKLWIEAQLLATNDSSIVPTLDKAIEIVKRERAQIPATNLSLTLQSARDLSALEEKKRFEIQKAFLTPIYGVWRFAASEFQTMLDGPAKKCGAKVETIVLPSLDALCTGHRKNEQIINDTNCSWRASYEIDTKVLVLRISGKRAKPAVLSFRETGKDVFSASLAIEGLSLGISSQVPISNPTNWISETDRALGVLIESQAEEFR